MKKKTHRIKLYIATSLDGFIAREDGSIDWLTEYENSPATDYGYSEFYASIGTVLMGRKTYEQVLGFGDWPYGEKNVYVFTRQKEPLHHGMKMGLQVLNMRSRNRSNIIKYKKIHNSKI